MDETGTTVATPINSDPELEFVPWMEDFSSGYIQRSLHLFPKQGSKHPWKLYQNYAADKKMMLDGEIDDGILTFTNPVGVQAAEADLAAAE